MAIEKRPIPLLPSHTAWNRRSIRPHDLEKTHKSIDDLKGTMWRTNDVKSEGVFHTLAKSKWCDKGKHDFFVPLKFLGNPLNMDKIIAIFEKAVEQFKQNEFQETDYFVLNNIRNSNSNEITYFFDIKGYKKDYDISEIVLVSTRSELADTIANNKQATSKPEKYKSTSGGYAAFVSFTNAALFEFGDELYCLLRSWEGSFKDTVSSSSFRSMRKDMKSTIETIEEEHPWICFIASILGYMLAPIATIYLWFVKGKRGFKNWKEVFSIYLVAELFENGIVTAGQAFTYQDTKKTAFAALFALLAGFGSAGGRTLYYRLKNDINFRYSFITAGVLVVFAVIYLFILKN
ncbi:MAG: hypothetical protein GY777_25090 [Candidatus Brocadiaceae bacterium]|nr:hypothetical protein [Candidatus Brocadiaceae bacterium]